MFKLIKDFIQTVKAGIDRKVKAKERQERIEYFVQEIENYWFSFLEENDENLVMIDPIWKEIKFSYDKFDTNDYVDSYFDELDNSLIFILKQNGYELDEIIFKEFKKNVSTRPWIYEFVCIEKTVIWVDENVVCFYPSQIFWLRKTL